MMKHYWKIKSENFEKIILWRMGKFYEMFYEDAIIVNRYFDLTWMGNKLHVAIHHQSSDKYIEKLVSEGYKVGVVDQTETNEEMLIRVAEQKSQGGKVDRTLQRTMTSVVTKGTVTGQRVGTGLDSRYLMVLRKEQQHLAVVLLECSTHQMLLAYLPNDHYYRKLKTLIM